MVRRGLPFGLLVLVAFGSPLSAEKIDLTPKQLWEVATHVVAGKVTSVYAKRETGGNWQYTRYLAEIRVGVVQKGEGLKQGEPIYVRYWRRSYRGPGDPPPSTGGHRGLPAEGDVVRVYLARDAYDGFTRDNNDGGFNVIGANGFAEVKVLFRPEIHQQKPQFELPEQAAARLIEIVSRPCKPYEIPDDAPRPMPSGAFYVGETRFYYHAEHGVLEIELPGGLTQSWSDDRLKRLGARFPDAGGWNKEVFQRWIAQLHAPAAGEP